jgi:hypothetical protein
MNSQVKIFSEAILHEVLISGVIQLLLLFLVLDLMRGKLE